MQILSSLLALTLAFAPLAVGAETPQEPVDAQATETQALDNHYVGTSGQTTDAQQRDATHEQRGSNEKDRPYETPLSAYNNNGLMGQ